MYYVYVYIYMYAHCIMYIHIYILYYSKPEIDRQGVNLEM